MANPEDFQKKKQQCEAGKNMWNAARAVCVRKPDEVISIASGVTQTVALEILNDTFWPWKEGSVLTVVGD